MADKRAEQRKVKRERRNDKRFEFYCDATVPGINGIQEIADISLGGFLLKGDIPDRVEIGQVHDISVKLPSEKYVTRLKAEVMRKSYGSIAYQLTHQNGHEFVTLNKFFNLYHFYSDIK